MRLFFFIAVATVFVSLINYYVLRHARRALRPWSRRVTVGLGAVLVLGIVTGIGGRFLVGSHGPEWISTLSTLGLGIELAVFVAAVLLTVVDVARASAHLLRKFRARFWSTDSSQPAQESVAQTTEPTRREFIENAASLSALAIGASSSSYGILFGRHDYTIETIPVRIPGLSAALDGYTIVQLSDIHFGHFVGEPELRAAVDRVRRARPDLVVLTGDLVDHEAAYAPFIGRLIRALQPLARDGVSVIPGNHDYYAGVGEVLRTASSAGGRVLLNQGAVIGGGRDAFALLGVDDMWARRTLPGRGPNLDHAIATVPADLPRILLSHNPAFFPEAAGKVALQLSGHTHGGQISLGESLSSHVMPFGYVAGMYQRDGSQLYVNRGFGTVGPPARIGSAPEISRFILMSDARAT